MIAFVTTCAFAGLGLVAIIVLCGIGYIAGTREERRRNETRNHAVVEYIDRHTALVMRRIAEARRDVLRERMMAGTSTIPRLTLIHDRERKKN